jgi:hypothetical protein
MPIATRQNLAGFKNEATLGTAESITGAECTSNVLNMQLKPSEHGFTNIPAQNGYGQRAGVVAARAGSATFDIHAVGKGSSGLPAWADLLKACGCSLSSQTFSPDRTSSTGMTIAKWEGLTTTARYKSIFGAMGNAVFNFRPGDICPINFNFRGLWATPSTVSVPTVTHQTTTPPRFAGATLTIGGDSYVCNGLTFDMGNQIILRETEQTVQGYKSAWVVDRTPTIRISPEALPFGTGGKNWFTDYYAGQTAQIIAVLGTVSNNIITLTAPACQLITPPDDEDRNGILADSLEFRCNQNSDTEDSEYTIVFS